MSRATLSQTALSRATPTRAAPVSQPTRAAAIENLAAAVRHIEGLHRRTWSDTVSTGSRALDRLLPHRALRRGTLVEWLAEGAGNGAATLALIAAREACQQGGALVVIDRRRSFYPPAAAGLQIDLEQLIVVRPQRRQEEIWALDQTLRSAGVAAVLCWPDAWPDTALRRLQLAAEGSGALALMVRGHAARGAPSWAELRLGVEPLRARSPSADRRWRVELLRLRGAGRGGVLELELEERTGLLHEPRQANPLRLASPVAARASGRRSAGA